jgi:CheY-like chemotaxis protein
MFLEDDPHLHQIMLTVMDQLWNVEPVGFRTGDGLITWLNDVARSREINHLPELALLDVNVPGTAQGTDVAAHLRKHPLTQHIVVVLITGYTFDVSVYNEFKRNIRPDYVMKKPYPNFDDFQALLVSLILKRRELYPPPMPLPPTPPPPLRKPTIVYPETAIKAAQSADLPLPGLEEETARPEVRLLNIRFESAQNGPDSAPDRPPDAPPE